MLFDRLFGQRATTATPDDPVTLPETRLFCRLATGQTEDDPLLTSLIPAVTLRIERELARAIVLHDRVASLNGSFGAVAIEPFATAPTVTRLEVDETTTAIATLADLPQGRVWAAADVSPDLLVATRPSGSFVITYTAGWPVDDLPADLKLLVMRSVQLVYAQRDTVAAGKQMGSIVSLLQPMYRAIATSYQRPHVGMG